MKTHFLLGDVQLDVPDRYALKMALLTSPLEPQPGGLPFASNVLVSRETVEPGTRAADFCKEQLQVYARNMERFHHVTTSETVIAGEKCPLAEIRAVGPGGVVYGSLIGFRVSGASAFVLSASQREGAPFEAARAELLNVIQSFRLTEER